MAIKKVLNNKNGFPLFASPMNNLKIGSKGKIIVSDIWAFWDYIVKKYVDKNKKNSTEKAILTSYLEQAKYFYESAENSPVKSQALLYYYSF